MNTIRLMKIITIKNKKQHVNGMNTIRLLKTIIVGEKFNYSTLPPIRNRSKQNLKTDKIRYIFVEYSFPRYLANQSLILSAKRKKKSIYRFI